MNTLLIILAVIYALNLIQIIAVEIWEFRRHGYKYYTVGNVLILFGRFAISFISFFVYQFLILDNIFDFKKIMEKKVIIFKKSPKYENKDN